MTKTARYVIENGLMQENANGAFVLADDYEALERKLDDMAAENAALKQWASETDELWINGCDLDVHLDELPQTPATDAYLNSVRAEGAEIVQQKLMRMCEVAARNDKETIHALSLKAGQIADQLRAGEVK